MVSKYRLTKPAMGWPHVVRESDGIVMTPGELIKELNSLEQRLAAAEARISELNKPIKRAIEMLNNAVEYAANSGRASVLISYDGKAKDNYDMIEML